MRRRAQVYKSYSRLIPIIARILLALIVLSLHAPDPTYATYGYVYVCVQKKNIDLHKIFKRRVQRTRRTIHCVSVTNLFSDILPIRLMVYTYIKCNAMIRIRGRSTVPGVLYLRAVRTLLKITVFTENRYRNLNTKQINFPPAQHTSKRWRRRSYRLHYAQLIYCVFILINCPGGPIQFTVSRIPTFDI